MASISPVTLTITGSPTPGQSIVTVEYNVTFDLYDVASDQPYGQSVRLIGDDTSVAGDPFSADPDDMLATIVPAFIFATPPIIRASDVPGGGNVLNQIHQRAFTNSILDEDKADAPNPDEERAVVVLTPILPRQAGPIESNLVTLNLP
jgi:hypothetical protein